MRIPKREVLSYEDLRLRAGEFLRTHWPSGEIPVDIEHVVDVRFGIDIVPVAGLSASGADREIDGFLSADGREIYVDETIVRPPFLYRYRFTLAHELAHLHLHRDLMRAAKFRSIDEWHDFQASIPEDDRS